MTEQRRCFVIVSSLFFAVEFDVLFSSSPSSRDRAIVVAARGFATAALGDNRVQWGAENNSQLLDYS